MKTHFMNFFIIAVASTMLFACSRTSEEELFEAASTALSTHKPTEALEKYEELVKRFPKGKHAEEAHFQIANILNHSLRDYPKAIAAFREFAARYPHSEHTPKALFLIGFIFNNELAEFDSARVAYEEFLEKYPDSEMAPSAQFELMTMGKDLEELFLPEIAVKEESKSGQKKK